jgi:phospholipid/cholesterol/gamma-HCH transport system substrate-binding protein
VKKIVTYHLRSALALIVVMVIGITVGAGIVSNQRLNAPGWVPIIGKSDFVLRAQLTSVQGVLPGQGQAVTVSGVRVGQIGSVQLVDGSAIAKLLIEPRYARVYPDATVLLRPKTPLKDMVAELDPGSPGSGRPLKSGALLRNDHTAPDVNLEEILAMLDRDSRDYLTLLLADGATAFKDGGGRDLAATFRRFEPLTRHVGQASRLVARRRVMLRQLVGNLSQLSTELGARDRDIVRFIRSSAAVFRRFANQSTSLQRSVALLPEALAKSNRALAKVDGLGQALGTTSVELDPAARALAPALEDTQGFFHKTTPVFRDKFRPFARAAQPVTKLLREPTTQLGAATPKLKTLSELLNAVTNELAYKSPGKGADSNQLLFYVPWASHNTNSVLGFQDGIGPLQRGQVLVSCSSLQVLETLASPQRNPTLATLVQLLGVPKKEEVCSGGGR